MGVGSLTWRQLDQRILDGLRKYGPTPAIEVGYRCAIDFLAANEEIRRSLDRLMANGLVERYNVQVTDDDVPPFDTRIVAMYAATGVAHE
jgi:hypothetical protein